MEYRQPVVSQSLTRRGFLRQSGIAAAGIAAAALTRSGRASSYGESGAQVPGIGLGGFYNVRAFGAQGDGIHLDSEAINQAIEAAYKAGGGTIVFPPGSYLCFSIRLASHVTLLLHAGSILVAAEAGRLGSYDAPEGAKKPPFFEDFGHRHWRNSLIWGKVSTRSLSLEKA